MTRIPVHIPVTKFAVDFELGEARPYSQFEQLLLESVDTGVSTIEALAESMAVPTRLVIEGVVTLVHAGWVGIRADASGLQTTPAGAAAVASGQVPETLVVRRPHPLQIVMERHTGATCTNTSVTLHRTRFLDESRVKAAHHLPATVHDNSLDPSQSRRHVAVRTGQWIRWVDPDPKITSKNSHIAIGLFDTDTGRLLNVPEEFRVALEPILLERLGTPASPVASPPTSLPESRGFTVPTSDVGLVINGREHEAVLAESLESAASKLAICSAFITERCLNACAAAITGALERGVVIDLFWGYESASTAPALERVKKLAYDCRNLPGRLRFNREPTNSHAKILLWNSPDGGWHTIIGSYNWLSALGTKRGEISVRMTSGVAAAQIGQFLGDVANALPGGRTDVVATGWARVADGLNATAARTACAEEHEEIGDEVVAAEFIFGRAHDALLRRAIVDVQPEHLVVLSGGVTTDGIDRLRSGAALDRMSYSGVISAGEIMDQMDEEAVVAAVESIGASWRPSTVHAKVLVHRDAVVVGSYNYLSTDPDGRSARDREVSIRLVGTAIREGLIARLDEVLLGDDGGPAT